MNKRKLNVSWHMLKAHEKELLEGCTKKYIVKAYVYNMDVNAGKAEGEEQPILILNFRPLGDDNEISDFRVFLSKTDYITEVFCLSRVKGRWKTGRLERVLWYMWYNDCACIDRNSEEEIRDFFDYTGRGNVLKLVDDHQQKIVAERLLRKHEEEEKKIDQELEGIPDVPEDLEEWTQTEAMIESRYIYYTYRSGKKVQDGYCTHCHHDVEVTPRHKQEGTCPHCESKVTFQAAVRSALFMDQHQVVCLQKWKDGFVARYFNLTKSYKDPRNPKVDFFEAYREVYGEAGQVQVYEMRKHPFVEKVRWYRGTQLYYYSNASVYPVGVRESMQGTTYQYSALEVFAENNGNKADVYRYLKLYKQYQSVEYLAKLGLTKLVRELTHHVPYNVSVNMNGKSLKEILKVGKERVEQLRQLNAGFSGHELVVEMEQANLHVPTEELLAIKEKLGLPTLKELVPYVSVEGNKKMGTLRKITKYLQSHSDKPSSTFSIWGDYIKFARELGYPMDREFTIFPRNLMEAHDVAAERWEEATAKERRESRKRLELETEELLKEQRSHYFLEGEDYFITAPDKLLDILKEGSMLRHCVGSYLESVAKGKTVILFLREKKNPTKPFFTIEVKEGELRQCRGLKNSDPPSEVEEFVQKFKERKLGQRAS